MLVELNADELPPPDYLGHRNITHTLRYTRTAAARFEGLWR